MNEWWHSLLLEQQIFYGIGLISLFVLICQVTMLMLGIGGDALDVDFSDVPDGDHGSGLGLFSLNTITAFFLGFGWTGVLAINSGLGLSISVVLALIVGLAVMFALYFLLINLVRLQHNGTLNYANAIGQTATVYSSIPADNTASGQVEVLIQSRSVIAEARQHSTQILKPGDKVLVKELVGRSTFVVEPLE